MDIEFFTIVKWAITVLIAGFIAQFGKKFAEFIIERSRAKGSNRENKIIAEDKEDTVNRHTYYAKQGDKKTEGQRQKTYKKSEKAKLKEIKKKLKR